MPIRDTGRSSAPTRRLANLLGAALAVLLAFGSDALAAPGDELWSSRWCRPGANNHVVATTEFASQLVAGGRFDFMGAVPTRRVAAFNGLSWTSLGAGFNGDVNALVVFNGELYAGGSFTLSGATPLRGLARWTGSAWVDVGGGTNGTVNTLAVHNSTLVVGGSFDEVGPGTSAGSVATWNGTAWNTLGGGVVSGGLVNDAESFGGSLYVTGFFDLAGSASASNIARWNGTTWSALGSGLTDGSGDPFEAEGRHLRVWSSRLVVTGNFEQAGGSTRAGFATWNGTTWSTLGANPSFFSGSAWAIGDFAGSLLVTDNQPTPTTWRWTGTTWVTFVTGPYFSAIGMYGADLVGAGIFTQAGGAQAENIARWNGSTWSALTSGDGASTGVERFFEWNGMLVTGLRNNTRFGPVTGTMVAGWNGAQWSGFGTGIPGGVGGSVSSFADMGGAGLAVGGAFTQAGGVPANKAALWNGAAWTALGGSNTTVECMQWLRGNLYAYGTAGAQAGVVRWNGSAWVSVGNTNDIVWDLDVYDGRLVAAGSFTTIGGASIRGLASWDSVAGAWTAFGSGVQDNGVFAIEVNGTDLYAAGTFTSIGGVPANRVAVWNGASWTAIGGGVNNRVFDLRRYHGELFATGEFTQAEGSPANYVARWNGTAWSAMGSGLNARGICLGVFHDTLFVGGDFTQAGGKSAVGLSSWSSPVATGVGDPRPLAGLSARVAPSPFVGATTLSWSLPTAAPVRAQVYDLGGRVVATLHDGVLPAGSHARAWDGRDAEGRIAPPGVYLYRIVAGDRTEGGRLVRLR